MSAGFPVRATRALADERLRGNLAHATSTIRARREAAVAEVEDWEALREAGAAIKASAMAKLPELLEELERSVCAVGGAVHWARDGAEANSIVAGLLRARGAQEVLKVKSMVSEEIHLNEALASEGIVAHETDFAELVNQLAGDRSSHILVPAIHRNRGEIRTLFESTIARGRPLSEDPSELTAVARAHLRRLFWRVPYAVSGANFAVADTGSVVVVESEGNGRMCTTLPAVLISVMGIEKVLASWQDLEVFLALLARSATGERMSPYTSVWTGVHQGDGPQEFHLVLLDNGRTDVLGDVGGREALHCIRCSACLNVCPVYSRVGGHAYDSVYPGPIGAVLTPQLRSLESAKTLPWASSLCGACLDVCPVKIDIPQMLVHLRGRVRSEASDARAERLALRLAYRAFSSRGRYEQAQRLRLLARGPLARLAAAPWTRVRELPVAPPRTFRQWWHERR